MFHVNPQAAVALAIVLVVAAFVVLIVAGCTLLLIQPTCLVSCRAAVAAPPALPASGEATP